MLTEKQATGTRDMNISNYLRFIANKLTKEFEYGLDWGFGPDHKIYEYINDIKVISRKIQELEQDF